MYKLTREQARMRRLAGLKYLADDEKVEVIEQPASEPVAPQVKRLQELESKAMLEQISRDKVLSASEKKELLELRRGEGSKEQPKRLLTEQKQCSDGCNCKDCFRELLGEKLHGLVQNGTCSVEQQPDGAFTIRCLR